jgi:hypothetical protein
MRLSHRYLEKRKESAILPRAGAHSRVLFAKFDVTFVLATDVPEVQHESAGTTAARNA